MTSLAQALIIGDPRRDKSEALLRAAFGGVDILVNNVGISMVAPSDELDPADWERAIRGGRGRRLHDGGWTAYGYL
jgi:NADP-dependent 3-hydroxy acid dehydrogenase YdfG